MSTVEITVQGRATTRMTPSRAVVRVSARAEGTDRAEVLARVDGGAEQVTDAVTSAESAVWSSGSVRSWTDRPWSPDGQQMPVVFHAAVEFEVQVDLSAASALLGFLLAMGDVTVDGIEWTVAEEAERSVLDELRYRAVADATEKAELYAQALGLSAPVATAVADAGMLDGGHGAPSAPPIMMRAMSGATDASGLVLSPAPIELEAVVDIRFAATSA